MSQTNLNNLEIANIPEFQYMSKIARLSRGCTVTEKLDGTNASIYIGENGEFLTGSRTKWIQPGKQTDNYGFSQWAHDHREELIQLGPGHHFGEWWGRAIQRNYGLQERRFSLFNTNRWSDSSVRPTCCQVVPVLYEGIFSQNEIEKSLLLLQTGGSMAVPGFMQPEGVIIYHHAARQLFKKTIQHDDQPKGQIEEKNEN